MSGHSTGERYLRGSELAKMERCAVTMLMGCSSGKLRHVGDYGYVSLTVLAHPAPDVD